MFPSQCGDRNIEFSSLATLMDMINKDCLCVMGVAFPFTLLTLAIFFIPQYDVGCHYLRVRIVIAIRWYLGDLSLQCERHCCRGDNRVIVP